MRPEDLDVALRPRSSWEAMELGTALLRRHAGAAWRPWLLATLPVLAILNAAAWWLDRLWLAALLMWWLKPLFERIPLYVLSRGVFGRTPGSVETLRAQWRFGRGALPAYLLWRRLSPARALLMPVDMLEGTAAAQRRARRRVIGGPAYGQAALLVWTCWLFELALALGVVATVFIAIPPELLPGSLKSFWALLLAGLPAWMKLGLNLALWLAASVVAPFHVAAGFGLYLNRRTETEAWDVELAFRRLRERLAVQSATPLAAALLACALLLPSLPLRAQQAADGEHPATLPQVFGAEHVDDARFRDAAARAYRDPLLGGQRTIVEWKLKRRPEPDKDRQPPDLSGLFGLLARIGEWGLWIAGAVLVLALLLTAPRWLPWLRGSGRRSDPLSAPVETAALPPPPLALPDDIASAARRLWSGGRPREALALLYRGNVEAMVRQAQVELPPGATEAQCLRAARTLPLATARELFAQVVRMWQYAAYAGRLPAQSEFDALLDAASLQWQWRR
ncbi:MAG: DUF4129 domain-containing protein [Pseudoxanthomonas sp.]|nr:DUF4129 domain-containing protein [Pseudoxanthomonas sp.]